MKKLSALFILLLFCASCASQEREVIRKSTIKLEGKHINIRDLLEIDGYYTCARDDKRSNDNIIFFENGTYANGFPFKKEATADSIRENLSGSIDAWIGDKQIGWANVWGVYRIEGDMIIGNVFSKSSFLSDWSFTEERYKIINRTTVIEISWTQLLQDDERPRPLDWPYVFVPAKSLPSSDNWLKEKKWIWRNESDWRAYMGKSGKGQN
jgi:hypothetical protein